MQQQYLQVNNNNSNKPHLLSMASPSKNEIFSKQYDNNTVHEIRSSSSSDGHIDIQDLEEALEDDDVIMN
jgi:hypothetical protein